MSDVILQAGHYPNGGGAPGEAAWTWEVAHLTAGILRARGLTVDVIGDFFNKPVPWIWQQYHRLAVSIHYDAPTLRNGQWDASGAFCDFAPWRPTALPARFRTIWEALWSRVTGIGIDAFRGEGNQNTDNYYGWSYLHPNTPAVLCEAGCGSPVAKDGYPAGGDAIYLHNNKDECAELFAQSILEFLGVETAVVPDDVDPADQQIVDTAKKWGLDAAAIDTVMGVNATLSEQVSGLTYVLGLAQGERDAWIAEAQRWQAEAEEGVDLTPEQAEQLARYQRIKEIVAA